MINEIDLDGIPEDTSAVECYCCPAELFTWTEEEGKRYYCRVENLLEDLFHVGAIARRQFVQLDNTVSGWNLAPSLCYVEEMLIREFPDNYGLPYEIPMSFLMNVGFLRRLR
jgi:hypothetical protein